jgi:hypothetical protein
MILEQGGSSIVLVITDRCGLKCVAVEKEFKGAYSGVHIQLPAFARAGKFLTGGHPCSA